MTDRELIALDAVGRDEVWRHVPSNAWASPKAVESRVLHRLLIDGLIRTKPGERPEWLDVVLTKAGREALTEAVVA